MARNTFRKSVHSLVQISFVITAVETPSECRRLDKSAAPYVYYYEDVYKNLTLHAQREPSRVGQQPSKSLP